VKAFNVTKVR